MLYHPLPFIAVIFIAAAASLLGSFVILRRMALMGDALSHVALPGMALGFLFNFNPYLGGFAFLIFSSLVILFLKYKTSLSADTLTGILFTSSLAVSVLIIPKEDLLEALFGNITQLTAADALISIMLSLVLISAVIAMYKKLAINVLSEELAHSAGINNKTLDFFFLLLFSLAVAIGIKFAGALLMGALTIIPAAAAKNVSRSLRAFMINSVVFGVAAAIIGMGLSYKMGFAPGPLFILTASAIFVLSLFARLKR